MGGVLEHLEALGAVDLVEVLIVHELGLDVLPLGSGDAREIGDRGKPVQAPHAVALVHHDAVGDELAIVVEHDAVLGLAGLHKREIAVHEAVVQDLGRIRTAHVDDGRHAERGAEPCRGAAREVFVAGARVLEGEVGSEERLDGESAVVHLAVGREVHGVLLFAGLSFAADRIRCACGRLLRTAARIHAPIFWAVARKRRSTTC